MSALFVSLAVVSTAEAVKMLTTGAMLAIAVYKATKIGRGRR